VFLTDPAAFELITLKRLLALPEFISGQMSTYGHVVAGF
jgi:hypothetical protein